MTTTTTCQKSTSRRKQKITKLITSKYFPRPSDSTTTTTATTTTITAKNRRIHISQTTSAKAKNEIGVTSCSSSNYFLRSPSSAYGSVLSLGPLVYTWIGGRRRGSNERISICNSREEVRLNCLRQRRRNSSPSSSRINDKERRKVCIYCAPILSEDAFRHFKDCLIFQDEQYKYYTIHDDDDDDDDDDDSSTPNYTKIAGNDDCNNDHDQYKMTDVDIKFDTELSSLSSSSSSSLSSLTCVELVGRWAEQHSVRHLCPNQCFLRAFAPIREWMVLRKKLEKYTPIGEILNDWTCRLVFDDKTTETETEEENQNTSTNDIEIPVNIKSPSSLSSSSRVQTAEERKQNSKAYTNQLTEFVSLKSGKTFSSFEKGRKFLFRAREAPQTCIDTLDNDSSIFATTNNNNNNKSTTTIMTGNRNLIGSTTMTTAVVGRLATDDTTATTASPFGLLEELFSEHPWRLLISTILLNKTKRNQNIDRILFRLFQRWPTVESVVKDANNDEEAVRDYIFNQVRITGLGRNKSKAFVQLSRDFLLLITTKNQNKIDLFVPYCQYTSTTATNTTTTCTSTSGSTAISPIIRRREVEFDLTRKEVKNISNCGDYAADAFQIFIRKDLDLPIISNDYILVAYVEWKRSLDI